MRKLGDYVYTVSRNVESGYADSAWYVYKVKKYRIIAVDEDRTLIVAMKCYTDDYDTSSVSFLNYQKGIYDSEAEVNARIAQMKAEDKDK